MAETQTGRDEELTEQSLFLYNEGSFIVTADHNIIEKRGIIMKLKKALAAGLSTSVLFSSCLGASAAPLTTANLTSEQINSYILNVEAYKQAYPDLAAAFGDDEQSYVNHYLTAGVYEGRTKGALFDPLTYAEAYGDIRDALGYDVTALVNHYVNYGVAESRTMGTSHGYADIAAAESSGLERAYIPRSTASEYQNVSGENSPAVNSSPAVDSTPTAAANTSGDNGGNNLSNIWNYHHTTSIYHDDGKTLWRVEYYDENNNLKQYSSVTDVDLDTNSYTENVYSYDNEKQEQILERTDTYVNGVLVSSTAGSN